MKNNNNQPFNNTIYNFGPQHPAAHGVLRVIIDIDGEVIKKVDPHIGLIHRGTEKIMENRNYTQSIPYMDRLDYVSPIAQEHTYLLAMEYLLNIKIPVQLQLSRMFFIEITRLINHIMSITTHALDIGAITPFLWGFDEREKLMEIYEQASGSRIHAAFVRLGGISTVISEKMLLNHSIFLKKFRSRIDELEALLSKSSIWEKRLGDIGMINKETALEYAFSGVLIRGVGVPWDLRKTSPYEKYANFDFKIPISYAGDSYGRYYVRVQEMKESINIIDQVIQTLLSTGYSEDLKPADLKYYEEKGILSTGLVLNKRTTLYELIKKDISRLTNIKSNSLRERMKRSMETVINHFKQFITGFSIPEDLTYIATESPKGEFGIFLISNGTEVPVRTKIRAPGFFHIGALDALSHDLKIADLVSIIGSLDIVFGEIDR